MKYTKAQSPRFKIKQNSGFTLLEVMVVVVIIAVMAAAVGPAIFANLDKANRTRAKTDIESLVSSLKMYQMENFHFPSTDQGLDALMKKPSGDPAAKNWRIYNEKTPIDPWGEPYKYLSPGTHGVIDVYTFGADGVQSEDDIGNWESEN